MHGRGLISSKDRNLIFAGDFVNGMKQGEGILKT